MTEDRDGERCLNAAHLARVLVIEDARNWGGGLALHDDGVYRLPLDKDVLATLARRDQAAARGAGAGLVLRLPCTFGELEQLVADEGLADSRVLRRIALLRALARRRGEARASSPARTALAATQKVEALPASEADPARRLRRLRELGGSIKWLRGRWDIDGFGVLERAERDEGRPRCSPKTIRADLHEAAEAERAAARAGLKAPSPFPDDSPTMLPRFPRRP